MPVADYEMYCKMLDRARESLFAYPAINVTSLTTANAVLKGLAESRSDGIIQVSTGGGAFASGSSLKDMALGAISIAEHVHRVAERYDIYVALHTDHCQGDVLDKYVIPLIEETERRWAAGKPNLFNSHMFDGSALSLKENLDVAVPLLERCHKNEIILEVECGVVGGEEEGAGGEGAAAEQLYTTPEDMLEVARRLNAVKGARYLVAATFGNVHGVYKPGHVKLKPETLEYGVVKMNIDTDTQYAFTRPIADHMLKHYDGVLKVDGEVGNKKTYDPRSYLKSAEASMAERVKQAVEELRGGGTTLFKA
jgi:fructose-bisphosphate aldolase class II